MRSSMARPRIGWLIEAYVLGYLPMFLFRLFAVLLLIHVVILIALIYGIITSVLFCSTRAVKVVHRLSRVGINRRCSLETHDL